MIPDASLPETKAPALGRHDHRLARSITVTWWYTLSGVLFLELTFLLIALLVLSEADAAPVVRVVFGVGGLLWWSATCVLLLRYRRRADTAGPADWRTVLAPLLLCAAYAVVAGLLSGLWTVAAFAVVQALLLLTWPRGVRLRMVIVGTLVLVAVWIVDQQSPLRAVIEDERSSWWMFGSFAVILPVMSVLTLWWWDVLVSLDEARAAAGRLAATQERLRVATDVHDLQGHHLQVIALQLELAERLMERDPEAGMEQLRRARGSVDEARQGTRDIATRFRAVPLADEIANAVDLLRAAGAAADAVVDDDADLAPGAVLGPVIRETTTNVLRHGGGRRARLTLQRVAGAWRYEISNDPGAASAAGGSPRDTTDGSGLTGIARRVEDAGGVVEVRRDAHEFAVVATVPDSVR